MVSPKMAGAVELARNSPVAHAPPFPSLTTRTGPPSAPEGSRLAVAVVTHLTVPLESTRTKRMLAHVPSLHEGPALTDWLPKAMVPKKALATIAPPPPSVVTLGHTSPHARPHPLTDVTTPRAADH